MTDITSFPSEKRREEKRREEKNRGVQLTHENEEKGTCAFPENDTHRNKIFPTNQEHFKKFLWGYTIGSCTEPQNACPIQRNGGERKRLRSTKEPTH